jgi:hypothetical protein
MKDNNLVVPGKMSFGATYLHPLPASRFLSFPFTFCFGDPASLLVVDCFVQQYVNMVELRRNHISVSVFGVFAAWLRYDTSLQQLVAIF